MVVGRTSPSINEEEVFKNISETEVLSSVFPEIKSIPCLINSPLRKDNHPSFGIHVDKEGHLRYKDFATGEGGGLLSLLCKYWNCSYSQTLQKVGLMAKGQNIPIKDIKPRNNIQVLKHEPIRVEVKVRQWQQHDIDYWHSYGCSIKLLRYAEVYPISHKIIFKGDKKYIFGAPKYSYVFIEHKEGKTTKKIYSPYASKYKWVTDNDSSVIGLWDKVPKQGDKLCICSSLKDSIALWSNSDIPCIYLQGEAFNISNTALKELKKRFKTIFICFDNDPPGLSDSKNLSEKTGLTNIILPPFNGGKDISDYIKLFGTEEFKKNIVPLFKQQ